MEEYIIKKRRFYHEYPELSGNEKNTRENIKNDLKKIGIKKIHELENCYGLTADIKGKFPGKILALRADIDALEICEKTELSFASKNGNMHACGHDCHIAMLLGAAKILFEKKDSLQGTVRLIFQPGEENASGAIAMIKENVLDGVDAIYGAHIWGTFDSGLFDVSSGPRMACADRFEIKIHGVSSHASEPNLGIDAITVSASVINNLQQVVSRMNDPLNPLVLTIGKIDGGKSWNILSDCVSMTGTVRGFSNDFRVRDIMKKIISDTANAFGANSEFKYERVAPALFNNSEKMNNIAINAIKELYGEKSLGKFEKIMAAEDFGRYSEFSEIPSVFVFIGAHKINEPEFSNHSEKFNPDENILFRGAKVMSKFAEDFLMNA